MIAVAEFLLKYADPRGEIRSQVAEAASESEVRERFTQQGFLVYSVRPRAALGAAVTGLKRRRRKKLDIEKFLIFNQQFLTLIRAGLPILKSLDLLADRLTDVKLGPLRQGCPRPGAQRRAAVRGLRLPRRLPRDLRHQRAGRRKVGCARRGSGALHQLPEDVAGGAEEDPSVAHLSRDSDRARRHA